MASGTLTFQVTQLRFEWENVEAGQREQELHTRHTSEFGSTARREAAKFIQFDGGQEAKLTGESDFIGLLG